MPCYLLKFDEPINKLKGRRTCQYYLGWAPERAPHHKEEPVIKRIRDHWNGTWSGGKDNAPVVCRTFFEQGIKFTVACIWWNGTRQTEIYLKDCGQYHRRALVSADHVLARYAGPPPLVMKQRVKVKKKRLDAQKRYVEQQNKLKKKRQRKKKIPAPVPPSDYPVIRRKCWAEIQMDAQNGSVHNMEKYQLKDGLPF